MPLNKPSNVAPEAEHGSKGSGGPVLCNDGKMEQFCLCWFYVCVCACLCVYVYVFDYQLQHSFEGYNWDYIFVLFMF